MPHPSTHLPFFFQCGQSQAMARNTSDNDVPAPNLSASRARRYRPLRPQYRHATLTVT